MSLFDKCRHYLDGENRLSKPTTASYTAGTNVYDVSDHSETQYQATLSSAAVNISVIFFLVVIIAVSFGIVAFMFVSNREIMNKITKATLIQ